MKQKKLICNVGAFLFTMSIALNIWLFIDNNNLKLGIQMYKDMINDYSGGNINIVEHAVIDSIKEKKSLKHAE